MRPAGLGLVGLLAACAAPGPMTPQVTPQATPQATPQTTPAVTPEATPEPTPGCVARPDAVTLTVQVAPPTLDTTTPSATLAAQGAEGGLQQAHGRIAGLYTANMQLAGQIRVDGRPGCLAPRVRLVLSVTRVIQVASEHGPDSCRYAVTLAHERQHAAIDDALLAQADRKLGDAFRAVIAAPGALTSQSAAPLGLAQRDAVAPTMAAFERERNAAQRAIDTPAEYARLSRACPAGA